MKSNQTNRQQLDRLSAITPSELAQIEGGKWSYINLGLAHLRWPAMDSPFGGGGPPTRSDGDLYPGLGKQADNVTPL